MADLAQCVWVVQRVGYLPSSNGEVQGPYALHKAASEYSCDLAET